MITVIDVIRDMGVEPTPDLTWSVGGIVRGLYRQRCGELPQKDLRPKTDRSGGTHCFAVYPEEMRSDIEAVVKRHTFEASRQLDLFR
jgi:hypothetical protein